MKLSTAKLFALFLIAACSHLNWATAQNSTRNPPKTACVATKDIKAPQLYGLWQVSFTNPPPGLPATASMLLGKHAEFSDSLQGVVTRKLPAKQNAMPNADAKQNVKPDDKQVGRATDPAPDKDGHAPTAALAGDVEDGFVILDESSNNISISGTWNGQLVEGSCGREVKGLWKDTSASAPPDAPDVPFTLKKLSSW